MNLLSKVTIVTTLFGSLLFASQGMAKSKKKLVVRPGGGYHTIAIHPNVVNSRTGKTNSGQIVWVFTPTTTRNGIRQGYYRPASASEIAAAKSAANGGTGNSGNNNGNSKTSSSGKSGGFSWSSLPGGNCSRTCKGKKNR